MAAPNFIIRSYQEGDEYKINEMFNEVFNQNRDLASWYWKYRDNPYGSYIISLAVSDKGVLAAHYGGYPVKISSAIQGELKDLTTYQLGDKMTRQQFRGTGFGKTALIARTYLHFKAAYAKPDIPFAYGFAAHHSLRFGTLILGYKDIEPAPYRKIDMQTLKVIKSNGLKSLFCRVNIDEISDIDESWSDLFYRVIHSYKCLVKRDAVYLRWRYLKRPGKKYLILAVRKRGKLVGWAAFLRENNKIIWGDALFQPKDATYIHSIFAYLKDHSITDGVEFIECWFPPRPKWWSQIIDSIGFKREIEPNNIHLTAPIVYDETSPQWIEKHFYYTMGDSDLF